MIRISMMIIALTWVGLWSTPNQQGERLMRAEKFAEAAKVFDDPMRQGVAWYRAGEFDKATQAFARSSSPDSLYNLGNSWLMLGKYDKAIASYQHALKLRPDWQEAIDNRDLAEARSKLIDGKGGDMGEQTLGADKIVFDKDKSKQGQDTNVNGDQASTDASVQAVWLRQVQTNPADFLRSKFAYQQAQKGEGADQ
ncbi:Tetratricopeptide repeat protein [Rubripirellula lacrimiformis]|uniref:Tetratricopeptide repeat protein n=1 Tax=Rubripirellula lacrimiformis TaxID=1930273 RepID=A0A517N685_9BACT|nr:tetratricopeptide repeat protein [Rubripirellula lacrimiformis]QDT02642.1 Tetratricopeptide repeat protein [Rubripirellula lacrimiformis]